MNPLSYLSDKLVQVAYVVEDFPEAYAFFRENLGIPKFHQWDYITKGQTDKVYRGGPGDFEFSAAYAYSGNTQIELCKHEAGESIYKDWLAERGRGVHHIGFELSGPEEYKQAFDHLTGRGLEVAMGARYGDCQWCYLDTVAVTGSYTEIYWVPEEFREMFDKIKRGDF